MQEHRYVAKRLRFQNGERCSVLIGPNGLPVHAVTLYLNKYRRRGRAANTIHQVCNALALAHRELSRAGIDLFQRLKDGRFLSALEVSRLVDAAQYRVEDLPGRRAVKNSVGVIDIKSVRARRKATFAPATPKAVDAGTQGTRLRYIARYFEFLVTYFAATHPENWSPEFRAECHDRLAEMKAQVPRAPRQSKIDARKGLTEEARKQLLALVHPDSETNPWKGKFVRVRNWLILVLLLALGLRRGELLGLQIKDLHPNQPKLKVVRRADAIEDPRTVQPNAKTNERELELRPAIMQSVWSYIRRHRQRIKGARKHPQLVVADDGSPLSIQSIDKMFLQIRRACPSLPRKLSSHVLRHTWNDGFSEQAELLNLSDSVEQRARNEQQGWSDNSKTAAIYTRRHATKKGRELSLRLQEKLDVSAV